MSEMKILDKTKLVEFLEKLMPDFEVTVPSYNNGNLSFSSMAHARPEIDFAGRPLVPPKEYFFPQQEEMFTFATREGKATIKAHINKDKRVIWGIRPCDLYGIKTLDSVFLSRYVDSYYHARRENTILMGLNCNEPCEAGFCSSMGTGPFATNSNAFDLLFTNLGNRFLVEIGSKAGEELIERKADLFATASDEEKNKSNEIEKQCKQAFLYSVDQDRVRAALTKAWDDPLWAEESKNCILCGGCNFICPTCYCFNIEDIADEHEQNSTRVRYWDSCQLGGYTQMAAENTRKTQAERLRQRIYDKFSYVPARHNGAIGCTGCGRCTEVCPSEINITHILGILGRQK